MTKLNLFNWSNLLKGVADRYKMSLDELDKKVNMVHQSLYVLNMYLLGNINLLSNIDYENIRLALRIISNETSLSKKIKEANDLTRKIKKQPNLLFKALTDKINECNHNIKMDFALK